MVSHKEYECGLVEFLELFEKICKSFIAVLYPLEVVAELIVGVFTLIVWLMVLHRSGVDVHGLVGLFYELVELVVNGLVIDIGAVVLYRNSEIGNSVDIIVEDELVEAEMLVFLGSAVE